ASSGVNGLAWQAERRRPLLRIVDRPRATRNGLDRQADRLRPSRIRNGVRRSWKTVQHTERKRSALERSYPGFRILEFGRNADTDVLPHRRARAGLRDF